MLFLKSPLATAENCFFSSPMCSWNPTQKHSSHNQRSSRHPYRWWTEKLLKDEEEETRTKIQGVEARTRSETHTLAPFVGASRFRGVGVDPPSLPGNASGMGVHPAWQPPDPTRPASLPPDPTICRRLGPKGQIFWSKGCVASRGNVEGMSVMSREDRGGKARGARCRSREGESGAKRGSSAVEAECGL